MTSTEQPSTVPFQLILFGSPGTGKSHKVETEIKAKLSNPLTIKTVFHPEYTYGDFMGKLLPLSDDFGKVTYRYYPGHFMQAIAQAFKLLYSGEKRDVLLVIDEINRGNSASIFGTAFQLLDRNDDGWSSYPVNISEMEKISLLKEMGAVPKHIKIGRVEQVTWQIDGKDFADFPANGQIKLPPNLYIVATMNTSDESIYYMDSAFKRRWSWEYAPIDGVHTHYVGTITDAEWRAFVSKLNSYIRSQAASIRKVEDKQIGYFFIKPKNGEINKLDIQNKLMFFLWDTVFARDKRPLHTLLKHDLVTFGDFSAKTDEFVAAINALQ